MSEKKPFVFVCGGDEFLVSRLAKTLFEEKSCDITDDFGLEIVDGNASSVSEVETAINRFTAAVQTLPMFSDRKAIWMRDITFLADNRTGRSEGCLSSLERLQQILSSIEPGSMDIVLSASPIDRRRSFFKWCQKNSDYHFVDESRGKEQALHDLIAEESKKLGVSVAPDAAETLIGKINGNARLVVEELRKVATWLGQEGSRIEASHIENLVPNFGESDFFEATEAFFSGRLEQTLDAVRRHFFTNKESRPLLANLQGRNRLMIQIRVLEDAGYIQSGPRGPTVMKKAKEKFEPLFGEEATKVNFNLMSQNPWYVGKLHADAKRFTLKKLIRFQMEFTRAFEEILSRPNEQEQVIRELAVRNLGRHVPSV